MIEPEKVDELLSDLPRGRHPHHVGDPPHAYFELPRNLLATPSLQMEPGNPHSKIFLGVIGGYLKDKRTSSGRIHRYVTGGSPLGLADDRHHLLLANSRGDKGRAALITNLILAPATTSTLNIDVKGEFALSTARWRAEGLGQATYIADSAGVTGSLGERYPCNFNPMNELERCGLLRMVPTAVLIADALIAEGQLRDPHWDLTAARLLAALLVHVATHGKYQGRRDLVTVRELIMRAGEPDPLDPHRFWLESEMLANDACGGFVSNAAREQYDRAPGEASSVLSNLRKHTSWIDFGFMARSLRGQGIDLRDLKRRAINIYLVVRPMDMAALSGWLRLFIQLALAAHEEEPEQYGASTLLTLDEFHILQRMRQLESAAALIAGLGCKLYIVLQDLGQLRSLYPQSWETFIGNSGCIQVFSVSDFGSCEYVSKLLGTAPTVTHSAHQPTFEQATQKAATGESWSLGVHPLLTPEEVRRYFARDDHLLRQLILRPGFRPAVMQRAYYHAHELFAGKFD
ncbi:MAG: type IV secretory system conjugative DNA transfer family protein [Pirellulaceae bacterium]